MAPPAEFRVDAVSWDEAAPRLSAIRRAVFVVEQGVPEALEWDGIDAHCRHVLAVHASGQAIGTGRLLPDGHIGRMAVLPQFRGRGVGRALLARLIDIARARGDRVVVLHAQTHAFGFYRAAGFAISSGEFMGAGIPHVEMRLAPTER
jgi:predicted GNAT family N-acyltransferase